MSSGTSEAASTVIEPSGCDLSKTAGQSIWPIYAGLFGIVFAAAAINFFLFQHIPTTFMFDGWLYRWTGNRVNEFLSGLIHGHCNLALISDSAFRARIIPDGPMLPVFLGITSVIFGHSPHAADWQFVVLLHCIMNALSACLVMSLAFRIFRSRGWAFLAGATWGLYPAAIINCGNFYTETMCALLLLAFAWLITAERKTRTAMLAAGLLAGILFVQKPAFIPLIFLSAVWALKKTGNWKSSALVLVAASALVIGSWGICTKQLTGKLCLTAQRYPAYNGAVGWDTEADGRNGSNSPLLDLLIGDDPPPGAAMIAQWTVHRSECLLVTARKVTRLLATPWNDFLDHCLGIPPNAVTGMHLVLLFLAFCGIPAYLLDRRRRLPPEAVRAGDICLIIVAGHLGYLAFMTNSRYAFTAIPFWAVFSTYFLWQTIALRNEPKMRLARIAACAVIGTLAAALAVNAEGLTRFGMNTEVAHSLKPGWTCIKQIEFRSCRLPVEPATTILMVDGEKQLADACIEINGHKLDSGLRPLNYLDSEFYPFGVAYATLAHSMGLSAADLRQWRGAIFPPAWLKRSGPNLIKITNGSSETVVYGDSDQDCRVMLDPVLHASGQITPDYREIRMMRAVLSGHVAQSSWIAQGDPSAPGRALKDSLRIKIAVLPAQSSQAQRVSGQPDNNTIRVKLPETAFDKVLWWNTPGLVCISKRALKACKTTGTSVDLPDMPGATHVKISATGEILAAEENSRPSACVYFIHQVGYPPCILSTNPDYIPSGRKWRKFEFNDSVPLDCFGPRHIELALYPGPWLDITNYGCDHNASFAAFRNLAVEFTPLRLPRLSLSKLLYY